MSASANRLALYLGGFLVCFLGSCDGIIYFKDGQIGLGLNLGKDKQKDKCPPTTSIACLCGSGEREISIEVPQCSSVYRWKARCNPCNKDDEQTLCPKFRGCSECHTDGGDRCMRCPAGKFGDWCEHDCTCVNDGICEQNGNCRCTESYEGRNCEIKRGCDPPAQIQPPLQAVLSPPDRPLTVVYSCPPNTELRGQAISTCLSNKQWSSGPPQCLPKCPLLSAPANGRLEYSGSELVLGVSAQITCNDNYRLNGEQTITCLDGGKWSSQLPVCNRLSMCPDPAEVKNAQKSVEPESVQIMDSFLQDSKIYYQCHLGFEQLGTDSILCLYDGTWSEELPFCVKVSPIVPNCHTSGSEIIADVGQPVRILCPPECADVDFSLWGTSIYKADSSVCQAAVHSAKITNSGGPVAVINNGLYSHFTGSNSNNVESDSYEGKDESFRFDKLPPLNQARGTKDCPKGLEKLEQTCVFVPRSMRNEKEAEAICTNMGLQLNIPSSEKEVVRLVMLLNARGVTTIWATEDFQKLNVSNNTEPDAQNCASAVVSHLELVYKPSECNQLLHYVCADRSGSTRLASCEDPGQLENGKAEPRGQIEELFYIGSSIQYSCQSLHYLKGAATISCTGNGTWSGPKPTCIKVDACEEPPVPFSAIVTYLPPLETASSQRAAIARAGVVGSRSARLPVGLSIPLPESTPNQIATSAPETFSLPAGTQRIGTRAMYDCESRYYKLIGSRARRCQGKGQWSGRPPTCIPVCGKSDSPRAPFIVNGNATDIGQWPWQAGIARYLPDFGQWFLLCGASLVNERWVVTAAHCVTYAGTTLPIDPDKFQIYFGKYHRTDSKDDAFVQVRKLQEIHIHPDYDPSLFDADIALLQLDSSVQLNSRVQPVCLPTEQTTRENLVVGKKGVVTGWGMNENETYSETLQQAVLPVVSQAVCEKGYEDSDLPLTVTDNMYCAGFAQGKSDACSGDSGGPMVFPEESSRDRKWVLEGIVSWGSPRGCGNENQYGGFTTVSRFLPWINLFV